MKIIKKIIYGAIILIVLIQLIRIDKTNPEIDSEKDFIAINNPNSEVGDILRSSCYDCHSHETVYPWYTNVAPLSWWIKKHINEGREHLNFSVWADYDSERRDHKLEEIVEEVKEHEMPLKSYLIAHSEAKLIDSQREALTQWVQSIRSNPGQQTE